MRDELTCLEFQSELDGLVQGTVEGSRRTHLLAHAHACKECGMMLAVERHVTALSPAGFEDEVPLRMVREMWSAIRSRLGTTAPVERARRYRWFTGWFSLHWVKYAPAHFTRRFNQRSPSDCNKWRGDRGHSLTRYITECFS